QSEVVLENLALRIYSRIVLGPRGLTICRPWVLSLPGFDASSPKRLLSLHLLEENVLLRVRLARDRIQSIGRLRDQITCIAPTRIDRSVRRCNTLVLTEGVAHGDLTIIVGRGERRRIGQRNVRRGKVHRRARHAYLSVRGEAVSTVMRIRHVEVDGVVAVLCVESDVHVVRMSGVDLYWVGPSLAAIRGANIQNIGLPISIAEDEARRVGPRQMRVLRPR